MLRTDAIKLITQFTVGRFVFTLLIILGSWNCCAAKNDSTVVDTLNIYQNKCGVSFRNYEGLWFRKNYTVYADEMNKQDSLMFRSEIPMYIRVYNSKNHLWFEGLTDAHGRLSSDITYYRKSGTVEHIEHRKYEVPIESCPDTSLLSFEHPMRTGTWQYFRRDGTLKREKKYTIQADDCSWNTMDVFCRTITYNRNGKIRKGPDKKIKFGKVYAK